MEYYTYILAALLVFNSPLSTASFAVSNYLAIQSFLLLTALYHRGILNSKPCMCM